MSKQIATKVAVDLEKGDKCAQVLTKTNEKLLEVESKVIVKDSVIKYLKLNELSFKNDSASYFKKDSIRIKQFDIVKGEGKKYKRQRNIVGGTGIIVILYAIYESFKNLIHY